MSHGSTSTTLSPLLSEFLSTSLRTGPALLRGIILTGTSWAPVSVSGTRVMAGGWRMLGEQTWAMTRRMVEVRDQAAACQMKRVDTQPGLVTLEVKLKVKYEDQQHAILH